jgi:tetratricopeptide (TPR) repeat protein
VAVDWAVAPLPVATPLSDLGMVLPIAGAAAFLQEIKAGAVKWDGNPDPAVHTKIERIKALAGQRRWTEARELAETELKLSRHPLLVMAAGTMNFCEKRLPAAAVFFDQAISMDPENGLALFMRYLADRLDGRPPSPALRQSLAALDWRSPQEFYGFMARTWERQIEGTCAPAGAGTALEYSWLSYLSGLKLAKGDRGREARDCFAEALGAVNNDEWVYYLALSAAAAQLQQELAAVADSATRNLLQAELDALDRITVDRQSTFQEVTKRLEALNAGLAQPGIEIDERRELLKQLLEVAGQDDSVLLELAFVDATAGAWERSLNSLKVLLQRPGRESHARLSAGLLEGELLRQLQREKEATSALAQFAERTADRWYRRAARCLLGEEAPDSFAASAVVHPAYLLTARTALGLWAEGGKDPQGAVEHYREALASYLDEMPEYGFALGRIQRLRKPQP